MFARTVASLIVLGAASSAHDLYLSPNTFRPKPGETIRVEYHNGDTFPTSQVASKVERLRDMHVRSGGATTPFENFRVDGTATVSDAKAPASEGHYLLISRTLPNFIELAPARFEDYLQHEGLDAIIEWRKQNGESAKPGREIYSKYVKSLGLVGRSGNSHGAIAGLAIEFVPLADPYKIHAGGELPVRLLVRGKPAAGQSIEASNDNAGKVTKTIAGRTDANGEIRIPIASAGLWKIHTVYMERRADRTEADWESLWSSLTFEIATKR